MVRRLGTHDRDSEFRMSQRLDAIEKQIKSLVNAIYSREGIPQFGTTAGNESGLLSRLSKLESNVQILCNIQQK